MYGLGVNRLGATNTSGHFSVDSLFANGEAGVWYDPSDSSTLFKQTTGSVSAVVGDPVGLMLDKSQGLKTGPELITNGSFDSADDWQFNTGWSLSNGKAVGTTVTGSSLVQYGVSFVEGDVYKITFDATVTNGRVIARFGTAPTVDGPEITESGSYVLYLVANSSSSTMVMRGTFSFTGTVDNISVKKVLGNHAIQGTSVNRPSLRESGGLYYLEFDGVSDGMQIQNLTSGSTPLTAFLGYKNTTTTANQYIVDIQTGRTVLVASGPDSQIGYFDGAWSTLTENTTDSKLVTFDLVEDNAKIRVNGTQEYSDTTYDQLSIGGDIGLFGRYDMSANFLAGNMYQTIIRAAESTDEEIAKTETFVGKKTGVNAIVNGVATLDLNFGANAYIARNSNGDVL